MTSSIAIEKQKKKEKSALDVNWPQDTTPIQVQNM